MEIGLLIKSYSDSRANLLSALSYLIDDLSDFNDPFSESFIIGFETRLNIISRVYKDISFIDENIDLLKKLELLEQKGV